MDVFGMFVVTLYLSPIICAGAGTSPKSNVMIVSDSGQLRRALGKVSPGDMITLTDGIYVGPFVGFANGTGDDPILVTAKEQKGRNLTIVGTGDRPAFSIRGNFWNLNHLKLEGNVGLHVSGKNFWGEDLVVQNSETGIILKGEEGTVRKSYVVDATHAGILVDSGNVFLERNVIIRTDNCIVVSEEACCGHLKDNVCEGEVVINGKKFIEESTKHIG